MAQLPGPSASVTAGLTGTIAHAAPEVLAGEPPTVASDVYSLASTLFCLLSGRPPFAGATDQSLVALVSRITSDPPPDLRSRGVPEELCLVARAGAGQGSRPTASTTSAQLGRQLQAVQASLDQPITRLPIDSVGPEAGGGASGRGHADAAGSAGSSPPPDPRRRGSPRALPPSSRWPSLSPPTGRRPCRSSTRTTSTPARTGTSTTTTSPGWPTTRIATGSSSSRPHEVVLSDTSFRGGVYGEPLTALTDVSVRVRAQPVSPGAIFGMFCRYGPSGDYYQAVLRTDGEALILKSEPPNVTTLASGQVAEPGTGRDVRLRLDCTGAGTTRIALFADDEKVAEAKDEDAAPVRERRHARQRGRAARRRAVRGLRPPGPPPAGLSQPVGSVGRRAGAGRPASRPAGAGPRWPAPAAGTGWSGRWRTCRTGWPGGTSPRRR